MNVYKCLEKCWLWQCVYQLYPPLHCAIKNLAVYRGLQSLVRMGVCVGVNVWGVCVYLERYQ